ncbi:MAG: aminoglycoside 3'-phosphotransferase [Bacilli bacterium]|nr:aminoglycoside 3'-phosphotransferase [Bacilli bacterium]
MKNKFIDEFLMNSILEDIDIGCSGDRIVKIIKEDGTYFLKETKAGKLDREYFMLNWLKGKLSVPEVVYFATDNEKSYLITKKLAGEMICCDEIFDFPEQVISLAATSLKMLQDVDITGCPLINNIDIKLATAKYNLDENLVSEDDLQGEVKEKFKTIGKVYDYLVNNKPTEQLCFSHGDLSLPNVFYENDKITGFLDLGDAGVADYWYDIAILVKSIRRNYEDEKYEKMLFNYLNIEPDYTKIEYYILLTELFL